MRPLPRLHAVTTSTILAAPDFGVRAAAIASGGAAVALHARARDLGARELLGAARRIAALVRPAEAAMFVNARPDVAAASGATGVQLGAADLAPGEARLIFSEGWVGVSVHSPEEATRALQQGADFLMAGSIYPTVSHPGIEPAGLELVRYCSELGIPVVAIGGIDPARAREVRDAGGYGVAAISAVWNTRDSAAATLALLAPWTD